MPLAPLTSLALAIAVATAPLASVPTAVAVTCDITDASLSWGLAGGTGTYTPTGDRVEVSFEGSVQLAGRDGRPDLTIADPVVRLGGGSGVIVLDVSGTTTDGAPVDVQDVPFVDLSDAHVAGDDAVRTVADAGTALTEDGAAAVPGYETGTAFGPVSLSITVGKDCPTAAAAEDDVQTGDSGSPLLVGLVAAGVLAIAAIVVLMVLTRRRRA